MNKIEVIYAQPKYFPSFYDTLSFVANEKIYIEMIEAPPIEKAKDFQVNHMLKNGPVFYALDTNKVIGWCDVFPADNPRQKHRGSLGMGLLPDYRGQGIGSELLSKTIDHSKKFGIEKIELHVYTTNVAAIALYKKFNFVQEGTIKMYRKLDGKYFDCLSMAKFL